MATVLDPADARPRARTPARRAAAGIQIQSVARALQVLEFLAGAAEPQSLAEISAGTGLNASTCHHLLATLGARGYVVQNPRSRGYALGNKIFELSEARARQFNVVEAAMPTLRALNRSTGEAVHLAVLQGRELVTVAKLDSLHAVKVDSGFVGKSNAAHATALGKAILAWLPESELKAIIDAQGMTRFTGNTIGDLETLRAQLALVRRHGFAEDREEFQPGVICIGAAIRNYTGAVIASLSCSIPTMRASEETTAAVRERVRAAAFELSQALGSRHRDTPDPDPKP